MDAKLLELYAEFAVRTGVNLQKNQTLLINCPLEAAFFGRLCAEKAYAAGARDVVIHYVDEQFSRIRMRDASEEALVDVKPWRLRAYMDYIEGEGGACVLSIAARDPEIYKGLDTAKIEKASQANSKAMKPFQDIMMSNRAQWCILSIPTVAWAQRVFPGQDADTAVENLWKAIFKTTRVEGGNPVAAWEEHTARIQQYIQKLNGYDLDALHLRAANGTDLTVGLADGHVFTGVGDRTNAGVRFFANVPSEEAFTAPHSHRVDGVVKSSLPYVYNGNLIEGITARFEKGLCVEAGAEKGDALLQQLLSADEGARRLGEIALVPASSPIRQTGLLFYNTLFDENAACHMAFGRGYPTCVKGGADMSPRQLQEAGVNDSLVHEDVMIGTPDMDIDGITKSRQRIAVFRGGEWVL